MNGRLDTLFFSIIVSKIFKLGLHYAYADRYFDASLVAFSYHHKRRLRNPNTRNVITNTTKNDYLILCSRSEVMRVHTCRRFIFIYIVNR